jgi:hypothetical protein
MNDEQLLINYLANRDTPCPLCGYNLRGLQRAACPECNQVLVLRVDLAEHFVRAFVFAIVGLGAGVGICGLGVLAGTTEAIDGTLDHEHGVLLGVAATGFAIAVTGLVLLTRWRRHFLRMSQHLRVTVSLLCWAPATAVVGLLFWFSR